LISRYYFYDTRDTGMDFFHSIEYVRGRVPYEKFVLGHYGGHLVWEKVYEILTDYNVYFDTAYTLSEISPELFKRILDKIGAGKILFATDSPWRDVSEEVSILRSYGLDADTENKILYRNAEMLLGL